VGGRPPTCLRVFDTAGDPGEKPDSLIVLLVWQVGTNSVLEKQSRVQPHRLAVARGLARLRGARADVVLI